MDDLGNRMKRYERASRQLLTPRTPVIVRVDGRAFHTYTRGMAKPFDQGLMNSMVYATIQTAQEMSGFKLAYTQSDEASFLLTDFDDLDTQPWFGYSVNKLVSITASLFTGHFNAYMDDISMHHSKIAAFDGRAFNVPFVEVPNAFVWRQRDWERNSLAMLAQSRFSSAQLHGKNRQAQHNMLHDIGVNWADLTGPEKNGTFVVARNLRGFDGYSLVSDKVNYAIIDNWLTSEEEA